MPSWHELNNELHQSGSSQDILRRKYLKKLFRHTKRNTIVYYSGWLQKQGPPGISSINDADKNGFMTVIHKMDTSKGLDLILHTPGGEIAATESIVDYLKSKFGNDIRVIVPQIAMSAGTMIACASKEIVMGKQSSLGPIDPQFNGLPAHGIVEEFSQAHSEISADQSKVYVWQPIIAKYHPTLIGECIKAIKWAESMVTDWLLSNMLSGNPKATTVVKTIITELGSHALTLSHARHLSAEKCKSFGLNVVMMETDQVLQDLILSVHHSCIHTLYTTNAIKIIENHDGVAFINGIQGVAVPRGIAGNGMDAIIP